MSIHKKLLKKSIHLSRKNKYTRRLGDRTKQALKGLLAVGHGEVYNVSSFYPSIKYYKNQIDSEKNLSYKPKISLILPVYNTPIDYLEECIESVLLQSYSNWELCIADDASPNKNVLERIKRYMETEERIKLVERKTNGHISVASNSALKLASGEFVALLDHDDVLWPNALFEVAKELNRNNKLDLIYTDEDKIDGTGKQHSYPFLKPDFSPEFLESCNYITHFSCIRKTVIDDIGGFRVGYEGAQDWDLLIRVAEHTQRIKHIPKILYSWRIHQGSTASDTDAKPYVYEAQKKLLVDHLKRTNASGVVETGIIQQHRTIKYEINKNEKMSIFVNYSNYANLKNLVESLIQNTDSMEDLRIHIFVPGREKNIKNKIRSLTDVEISASSKPSNVNILYNTAVELSKTEYMLFIDDTVSFLTCDYKKLFIADAQRQGVGFVAPVILDLDGNIIKSAGVGVGYGPNGLIDMLSGCPFSDMHYTRGLYAKSRRNITAFNPSVFAVKKQTLESILKHGKKYSSVIDMAIDCLEMGMRNIYTPYIRACSGHNISVKGGGKYLNLEDAYLNPNFVKTNNLMEVRQ